MIKNDKFRYTVYLTLFISMNLMFILGCFIDGCYISDSVSIFFVIGASILVLSIFICLWFGIVISKDSFKEERESNRRIREERYERIERKNEKKDK